MLGLIKIISPGFSDNIRYESVNFIDDIFISYLILTFLFVHIRYFYQKQL